MVILLSVIGIIFTAAAGYVSLITVLGLSYMGIIVDVGLMAVAALFLEKLRKDMLEDKNISTKTFITAAEAVPVLLWTIMLGIVFYLDKSGYWHGQFFGGMFEILLSASAFGSGVVILISHIIIIAIKKSGK